MGFARFMLEINLSPASTQETRRASNPYKIPHRSNARLHGEYGKYIAIVSSSTDALPAYGDDNQITDSFRSANLESLFVWADGPLGGVT